MKNGLLLSFCLFLFFSLFRKNALRLRRFLVCFFLSFCSWILINSILLLQTLQTLSANGANVCCLIYFIWFGFDFSKEGEEEKNMTAISIRNKFYRRRTTELHLYRRKKKIRKTQIVLSNCKEFRFRIEIKTATKSNYDISCAYRNRSQ